MTTSFLTPRPTTLNAKVGAIALAVAAFLTLVLSHFSEPLAPLRLLTLALAAFAVWCFGDEMGLHKPLNRAGFVLFAIAVVTKVQIALGIATPLLGRYYLLYAAFLLAALLLWSVAFLHRQPTLKAVGVVGVLATLAPIVALIAGHLAVGAVAFLGVGAVLQAADGSTPADLGFVTLVDRMFGIWGYLTAWFLWRGYIRADASAAHEALAR
jgi:hypothetical protein